MLPLRRAVPVMSAGWQVKPRRPDCMHLGLLSVALFQMHRYDVGDVWVCDCGARFQVAMGTVDGRQRKQMRALS